MAFGFFKKNLAADLVLKNGKTVEYKEAGKVLNDPQDPYTKKLLAAVPRLKRKEIS